MDRNVCVIKNSNGTNIVLINDVRFKGKREEWIVIEEYLKE